MPETPQNDGTTATRGWSAELRLTLGRRQGCNELVRAAHRGPIRLLRPYRPTEGSPVQLVLVHPPGGMVKGDRVEVSIAVGVDTRALATTVGAGKWHRTPDSAAVQTVRVSLATGASLEWLPQEQILFRGAHVRQRFVAKLAADATLILQEIFCLGRRLSGERFSSGTLAARTRVRQQGRILWEETLAFAGGDPFLTSPIGLAGRSVYGQWLCLGKTLSRDLLTGIRSIVPAEPQAWVGASAWGERLVVRYLGEDPEAARRYFAEVWALIRPDVLDHPAEPPRIWNT